MQVKVLWHVYTDPVFILSAILAVVAAAWIFTRGQAYQQGGKKSLTKDEKKNVAIIFLILFSISAWVPVLRCSQIIERQHGTIQNMNEVALINWKRMMMLHEENVLMRQYIEENLSKEKIQG